MTSRGSYLFIHACGFKWPQVVTNKSWGRGQRTKKQKRTSDLRTVSRKDLGCGYKQMKLTRANGIEAYSSFFFKTTVLPKKSQV